MKRNSLLIYSVLHYLGVQSDTTSHTEKLISGIGAAVGILAIYSVLSAYPTNHPLTLVMASVAASAVLVFAVPHGALSQPWPVMGSYLTSAALGVTCSHWIQHDAAAAVTAVGFSVICMHYLRCLHPPGAAVALVAVTGGADIEAMGYQFIMVPALLNAGTLVGAAVIYNYAYPWRRYPVPLVYHTPHPHPSISENNLIELTAEDYQYALRQQDSFIDISPEDLAELVECAREHALSYQSSASTTTDTQPHPQS
jgi:CBS domain-containing membrane protein